jgi:hypothetical protein
MAALLVSHARPGFYFRVLEEGEVETGEEIIKVSSGAERMTVARINALLYLPGHRPEEVERALHIPALSGGWKSSFQALLRQGPDAKSSGGNPGLAPSGVSLSRPAWPGFRPVRVAAKVRESDDVISLHSSLRTRCRSPYRCRVSSSFCGYNRRPKDRRLRAVTRFPECSMPRGTA